MIFPENEDVFNKDANSIQIGNLRTLVDNGDGTFSVVSNELVDTYLSLGYSLDDRIEVGALSPQHINGTEIINSELGIQTWYVARNDDGIGRLVILNSDPNDLGHASSVDGVISNTVMWGINSVGLFQKYTTNTTFDGLTIIGDPENPNEHFRYSSNPLEGGVGNGTAIVNSGAPNGVQYYDVIIEGFERGVEIQRDGEFDIYAPELSQGIANNVIENISIANVIAPFITRSNQQFALASGNFVELSGVETIGYEDYVAPEATFTYSVNGIDESGSIGTVRLDATESFSNAGGEAGLVNVKVGGNGLIAYAWDIDSDGTVDHYGRFINASLETGVEHDVTLTVYDQYGNTDTFIQNLTLEDNRGFNNAIINGNFSDQDAIDNSHPFYGSHMHMDNVVNQGYWMHHDFYWNLDNGYAEFNAPYRGGDDSYNSIQKVIYNEGEHVGENTLSFDYYMEQGNESTSFGESLSFAIYDVQAGHFDFTPSGDITNFNGYAIPEYTVLYEGNIDLQDTNGWQSFTATLDIPEQYKFIAPVFGIEGNVDITDLIRVDNIFLGNGNRVITNDDYATAMLGTSVEIDVLANDYDAEGDAYSVTSITGEDLGGGRYAVDHGIVEILSNGNVLFTANNDAPVGEVRFAYTVTETQSNLESQGNVTVYIGDISAEDLVLYFDFEDNSGYGIADVSPETSQLYAGLAAWGTSNDVVNAIGLSAATFDNHSRATEYDPIYDEYLVNESSDHILISNSTNQREEFEYTGINNYDVEARSYSLWFNAEEGNERQVIMDAGFSGFGTESGFSVYLLGDQLYMGGEQNRENPFEIWASTQISFGEWNHVVLSYNGGDATSGQGARTLTAYLNGEELYSEAVSGDINAIDLWGSIALGSPLEGYVSHESGSGYLGMNDDLGLTGSIDEFRIYDRVLSSDEVSTLHSRGADDLSSESLYATSEIDTFTFDSFSDDITRIENFSVNDRLDISNIIQDYDPVRDSIDSFVQTSTTEDGHTIISVDSDGYEGISQPEALVVLVDTDTSLEDISDQIII